MSRRADCPRFGSLKKSHLTGHGCLSGGDSHSNLQGVRESILGPAADLSELWKGQVRDNEGSNLEMSRLVLENLFMKAWSHIAKDGPARIEFGMIKQKNHIVYFVRAIRSDFKNSMTVFIQEAALMECVHYLVWFEGPLNTILGEVCFLGVRAGLQFHVWRDSNLVMELASPQEIMDASVSSKAAYLRSNNVRLPQGVCDPKLRNAVAHMDIELAEDGSILYWPRLSERPEHTNLWKLQRQVWAVRDVCITIQKAVADTIGHYLPP